MTLPEVRSEQHAQILGFALIGFGIGWGLDLIANRWKITQLFDVPGVGLQDSVRAVFGWEMLLLLIRTVLALAAGVAIRTMAPSAKALGLLFVFASIYVFPLGTILSAYVLLYLFAISPRDLEGEVPSVMANQRQ